MRPDRQGGAVAAQGEGVAEVITDIGIRGLDVSLLRPDAGSGVAAVDVDGTGVRGAVDGTRNATVVRLIGVDPRGGAVLFMSPDRQGAAVASLGGGRAETVREAGSRCP